MAKRVKDELLAYRLEFGVVDKKQCTQEENKLYSELLKEGKPLPKGVFKYVDLDNWFYTVEGDELNDAEKSEYLAYKQLNMLKTIKNCVLFFTVLAGIGLVFGIISGLMILL